MMITNETNHLRLKTKIYTLNTFQKCRCPMKDKSVNKTKTKVKISQFWTHTEKQKCFPNCLNVLAH